MAIAIDATVGGASSNSYVTTTEADTYFEGRLETDEWDSATSANQIAALVMAVRWIDREMYKGVRVDDTQALQWPRYGVVKPDLAYSVLNNPATFEESTWYETTEIPDRVKNAQMECALALLKDSALLDDTGLEAYENVRIGNLDVTPRHAYRTAEIPESARRELKPLLRLTSQGVRLIRG